MDGDTVASPAVAWSPNELQSLARTDDFHISPLREDGKTYGTPTWIWSVVVDGDLYVRAYTAVIASVITRGNGTFGVEDVWVSFDAGTIVNSDRVRAQLEGAVIFGMSLALYGGITNEGRRDRAGQLPRRGTHRTDQRSAPTYIRRSRGKHRCSRRRR